MASLLEFFRSLPRVIQALFQPDDTTRALSVELWAVVPAVLVLIQFGVSSMGPRFAISPQINPGIELLRILSYYSVSYTLGLMKPSVSKQSSESTANDFFQIWAVLIVTMQDSARIGRLYRPKEMTLIDLLASLWSANQLRSQTELYLKVPLWAIWCIHAWRIICDYMAVSGHTDDNASADTMTGYKYLVVGEDRQEKKIDKPRFRLQLEETRPEELITVDKVWNWSRHSPGGGGALSDDDKLLGRHTDSDNRFKDVCLSFALYKLLRRRFYGMSMPEAKDQASRRLVSDAILDNTNDPNYDRVFRITEVELSFLQDFSYSKHAVVFARGFPYHRQLLSSCMIAAALYLAYAVRDIPSTMMAQDEDGRVARITHGVLITHFLIFIVVFRELLEIWVYVMSQWSKVLVVCHYIRIKLKGSVQNFKVTPLSSGEGGEDHVQDHNPEPAPLDSRERGQDHPQGCASRLQRWIAEKVERIMLRIIVSGLHRWIVVKNLLGRYVKLQSEVKTRIFGSLKALIISASTPGREENDSSDSYIHSTNNGRLLSYLGVAFADSEGSLPVPDSRRKLPVPSLIEILHDNLDGDTHKILAWHVATSLCQIRLLEEAGRHQDDLYTLPTSSFGDPDGFAALWPDYTAAATLSNYCVHLVTVALIPDNGLVASKVLDAVGGEARVSLRGCPPSTWKQTDDRLMANAWAPDRTPDGTTIVKIGAQLAVELLTRYGGRDELWRRLSKFWTGYLLYLSASTGASKHQIHLQGRGELTTHLWALLSHAGFLGVNTEHGQLLLDPVDQTFA
ncbi:hypothetical protein ACQ4PT_056674 [Festuca glaucescens]